MAKIHYSLAIKHPELFSSNKIPTECGIRVPVELATTDKSKVTCETCLQNLNNVDKMVTAFLMQQENSKSIH